MEKFELLGRKLSKAEQKQIMGGVVQRYDCTFTFTDGSTTHVIIDANNGTAAQCQADAWCWNNDTCTNGDCANSGACE